MRQIADSGAAEATVQLTADLKSAQITAGEPFAGIPDATVMISSADDTRYEFYLSSELKGGVVLDNVSAAFTASTVFGNGNVFETTDRFSGFINALYGGGAAGNDVAEDVNIVLRGGKVQFLYGGGLDSNVAGDVHITIDAPTTPGELPGTQTAGTLHGGGHARTTDKGRVSGNVVIDFRAGSNGMLFGGGMNEFDQDAKKTANTAAMVSGTVTVNLGYAGAPSRSVWPGLAMFSYAGSEYSTVGNTREYTSEDETHKTTAVYDGADGTTAYHYLFDEVEVTNGSQVLVDGDVKIFPMFDDTQKPFYSVKDLTVVQGSCLTTRDSSTQIKRNVTMDHGTWHAKGYTYVYEAMRTENSSIFWDTYYQAGYAHEGDVDPTASTSWRSSGDTVVTSYNGYLNKVYGNVEVTAALGRSSTAPASPDTSRPTS